MRNKAVERKHARVPSDIYILSNTSKIKTSPPSAEGLYKKERNLFLIFNTLHAENDNCVCYHGRLQLGDDEYLQCHRLTPMDASFELLLEKFRILSIDSL